MVPSYLNTWKNARNVAFQVKHPMLSQSVFHCWNRELVYNSATNIRSRFFPGGAGRWDMDDLALAIDKQQEEL